MSRLCIRFHAIDSWFFRESRPMEAIGGSELSSIFPPTTYSLIGAVRTWLGESHMGNSNWKEYHANENHPLRQIIGYDNSIDPLRFFGSWIYKDNERLYPVPLNLIEQDKKLSQFKIGKPVHCHLGKNVRLPIVKNNEIKPKILIGYWVTESDFCKLLKGDCDVNPISSDELFKFESRLGIARDNASHTVEEGRLYQTRHLRPLPTMSLGLDVEGIQKSKVESGLPLTKVGGEGKMANIKCHDAPDFVTKPEANSDTYGIILYLLTPAAFDQSSNFFPQFTQYENATTVWKGDLNGIKLTMHSAVKGETLREGGWNMKMHQARPSKSLIPTGSCWYCTVDDQNIQGAIDSLHQQTIGEETKLGRGILAVGLWQKTSA